MNEQGIKLFQVDDWAYVAARSAEEAAAHIEVEASRPDDLDDREVEEVEPQGNFLVLLQKHLDAGDHFPITIGIDSHYA